MFLTAQDANLWLMSFIRVLHNGKQNTGQYIYLRGFWVRLCKLLSLNVKLIFVFDNTPPLTKSKTIFKRKLSAYKEGKKIQKLARQLLLNQLKLDSLKNAKELIKAGKLDVNDAIKTLNNIEHIELNSISLDKQNTQEICEEESKTFEDLFKEKYSLKREELKKLNPSEELLKSNSNNSKLELLLSMYRSHVGSVNDIISNTDKKITNDEYSVLQMKQLLSRGNITRHLRELKEVIGNEEMKTLASDPKTKYKLVSTSDIKSLEDPSNFKSSVVTVKKSRDLHSSITQETIKSPSSSLYKSDLDELLSSETESKSLIENSSNSSLLRSDGSRDSLDSLLSSSMSLSVSSGSIGDKSLGLESDDTRASVESKKCLSFFDDDDDDMVSFEEQAKIDMLEAEKDVYNIRDTAFPMELPRSSSVIDECIGNFSNSLESVSNKVVFAAENFDLNYDQTYCSPPIDNTNKRIKYIDSHQLDSTPMFFVSESSNSAKEYEDVEFDNVEFDQVASEDEQISFLKIPKLTFMQHAENTVGVENVSDNSMEISNINDMKDDNVNVISDDDMNVIKDDDDNVNDIKDDNVNVIIDDDMNVIKDDNVNDMNDVKDDNVNIIGDKDMNDTKSSNINNVNNTNDNDTKNDNKNTGESFFSNMKQDLQSKIAEIDFAKDLSRRNASVLTEQIVDEIKEMLSLFGIPFIDSPSESDAQCAYLEIMGVTSGTITDDNDVLVFGGKNVFRHTFSSQRRSLELYSLEEITKQLSLTQESLVFLAHLLGSDYGDGVKGVGPVAAYNIVKNFDSPKHFKCWINEFQQFVSQSDKLSSPTKTEILSFKSSSQKNPCSSFVKKHQSLLRKINLSSFPSNEVTNTYMNPNVIVMSRSDIQWNMPNLEKLKIFAWTKLRWTHDRVESMVQPLIQNFNRSVVKSI